MLTLGACGTSSPLHAWRWDKAGTTGELFARDRYYCLHGATRTEVFLGRERVDADRFAACMAIRGYTRSATGRFGTGPEEPPAARPRW